MAYQTPRLMLVGSASGLVHGQIYNGSVGPWSDTTDIPHEGIARGNSRIVHRD